MLDTLLPLSPTEGLMLFPVASDYMEPTLVMGKHVVLAKPVDRFDGEGMYVLDGGEIRHVERGFTKGGVRIYGHNRKYWRATDSTDWPHRATDEQFATDVVAKVVADICLHDHIARDTLWKVAADYRRIGGG